MEMDQGLGQADQKQLGVWVDLQELLTSQQGHGRSMIPSHAVDGQGHHR